MIKSKNVAVIGSDCVACGNCVKVCKFNAISIFKGLYAKVDYDKCVGCKKCADACPASVIMISSRGETV